MQRCHFKQHLVSLLLLYSCILFKKTSLWNKGKANRIKFYVFQQGYTCSLRSGDLDFAAVYAQVLDKGKRDEEIESSHNILWGLDPDISLV